MGEAPEGAWCFDGGRPRRELSALMGEAPEQVRGHGSYFCSSPDEGTEFRSAPRRGLLHVEQIFHFRGSLVL